MHNLEVSLSGFIGNCHATHMANASRNKNGINVEPTTQTGWTMNRSANEQPATTRLIDARTSNLDNN